MNRHDIVRPTAFAIDRTHYTKTSLLTLMLRKLEDGTRCRSCRAVLVPGELYARGAEVSANLCLGCVEPAKAYLPKSDAERRRDEVSAVLRRADRPLTSAELGAEVGMEGRAVVNVACALERRGEAVLGEDGWVAA